MKAGCKTFLILVELIIVYFICFNIAKAETILFQDDFEDGNNFGWTAVTGTWDASLGYNEAVVLIDSVAYTYAGNPLWEDYIFDVDITFGTGITEFFVAVRADPSSSLDPGGGKQYYLSVDGDNDEIRLRYTLEPFGLIDVQTVPFLLLDQTTYHIKISINGNNLQASIDGVPLFNYTFSGTDPIYESGLIGIGYLSNEGPDGAHFDNVIVVSSQPSEVWVDDDYCNSCSNDGHTWDYDAFDNIQSGIDAVASPGTVYVAAGIYEGKVVLKTQVSLLGTGIGVSIIDGLGLYEENVLVEMASASILSGFSIINSGGSGVIIQNAQAIIEGNLVAHNKEIGIALGYNVQSSIVRNNIVTDCGSYGGIFGNTVVGSPQIIHNTVVGNTNGIGFWYRGTPIIKNNIIVNNKESGIVVGGNPTYGVAEPVYSHNNVWNNTINWNDLEPGEGAISENPLFVNESGGDYHLQKGSPCIDAGTDVGVYVDMDGDVRPFGAGFDMGADEFVLSYIWVDINIYPRVLNLKSKGKNIISFIRLPVEYDPHDIASDSLELSIPSCSHCEVIYPTCGFPLWKRYLAFFPRQDLIDEIESMSLELPTKSNLRITGELNDGTPFEGLDTIRVINIRKKWRKRK